MKILKSKEIYVLIVVIFFTIVITSFNRLSLYIESHCIEEEYKNFKAMRQKIKKPLNDTACKLLLTKLKELEAAGYKPKDLLETATANCWLSVYAPKEESNGNSKANGSTQRTVQTPLDRHYAILAEREANRAPVEKDVDAVW